MPHIRFRTSIFPFGNNRTIKVQIFCKLGI
nr:MAG TPA: cytochrome oxidase subunit [Caudoviricetes sp.]